MMVARRMCRKRNSLIVAVLCLLSVAGTAYLLHSQCLKPSISYYKILEEYTEAKHDDPTKYILLFTDFFNVQNWGLNAATVESDYFANSKCEETKCVITTNKKLLAEHYLYDAIVFHISEQWKYSIFSKVPSFRKATQIYVAASMESPAHTKHLLEHDHDFYNWTMTYRLDSDIVWSYSSWTDIDSNQIIAPSERLPPWKDFHEHYHNNSLIELAKKKSKMAAWFVSHCGTFSKRDNLVNDLKKHMNIDVYGSCGDLKCPIQSPACTIMLDEDYKFYIAFENSLCKDYVTEKLFHNMKHDIVPVVFGGADYARFAPPHSYINANDFATSEDLAKYLIYLDGNPEEYIKYFWWKPHYKVTENNAFCDLCKKLHDPVLPEKTQVYRSIKDWWYKDQCHTKPKIKFNID